MLVEVLTDPPTNGNVIDSKEEQPLNAALPILVTLLGIVIDFSDEHP